MRARGPGKGMRGCCGKRHGTAMRRFAAGSSRGRLIPRSVRARGRCLRRGRECWSGRRLCWLAGGGARGAGGDVRQRGVRCGGRRRERAAHGPGVGGRSAAARWAEPFDVWAAVRRAWSGVRDQGGEATAARAAAMRAVEAVWGGLRVRDVTALPEPRPLWRVHSLLPRSGRMRSSSTGGSSTCWTAAPGWRRHWGRPRVTAATGGSWYW